MVARTNEPPVQYALNPKSLATPEIPIRVVPLIQVAATENAISQGPELRPATAMSSIRPTRVRAAQMPIPNIKRR